MAQRMIRRAKPAARPAGKPRSASAGGTRAVGPQETELKLHLPAGAADMLTQRPVLRSAAARRQRLDNIYLDTADRLLQRKSMALRLRGVGRQWMQTLKTAGESAGGLGVRGEWETPARMRSGKPYINLAAFSDTPLPELLKEHGGTRSLVPVFRTRVTRELRTLSRGRSVIEVAIDRGRIETVGAGRARSEPISEVELELKEGRVEDLMALALRLAGRGQGALALVPAPLSKAERGYLLADDRRAEPVKAAAKGFLTGLKAGQSAGAALRSIMAHGLSVLLANTEAMRHGSDDEHVHQARVALRRMRSALRLLDRKHDDFPQALADELRWAGRLLGAARDWDVLIEQTLPALAASVDGARMEPLLRAAGEKRSAARQSTVDALRTPRYAQLALRLHAWAMTPAPKGPSLARLSAPRLREARRQLLKSACFFVALSPGRRHRVRILAKRLRYALDVLSVALPKAPTEHYTSALSDLQDVLGELNDLAVARTSLASLSGSDTLDPGLSAPIERRERELLVEAEVRLLALAESKAPWD